MGKTTAIIVQVINVAEVKSGGLYYVFTIALPAQMESDVGSGALVVAGGTDLLGMSNQFQHGAGDQIRVDLWRSALAMVQDYPVVGVGPGLFGQAFRNYWRVSNDNMTGAHSF
jgi:O-antigen ligase